MIIRNSEDDWPVNDYKTQFNNLIQQASIAIDKQIDLKDYEIIDLGVPHIPRGLPKGKMGIYSFLYNDQFLKIGQAYQNSGARFLSHHYNPQLAPSTLAASLLADRDFEGFGISESNIKEWIKANCRRIDILMNSELGKFSLGFVEAI